MSATLAAFAEALRGQMELTQITAHLASAVQETMQPTSVSLWLRPPAPDHAGTTWQAQLLRRGEANHHEQSQRFTHQDAGAKHTIQ